MGEVVDLQRYRKQRQRRASASGAADRRGARDRAEPKGERIQPVIESFETARAESVRAPKIDRDGQESD